MPLHPLFVVRFDRILATSSDYRPNFTIRGGAFANVTFREIRVDPVAREVVFAIADDLLPHTRYVLHVESAPDPATRLCAIDGAPLAAPVDVPFWTEDVRAPGEIAETELSPDARASDACDAAALLSRSCAGSSCHGGPATVGADGGLVRAAPALGLDLSSSDAIQATAIGRAAVQVAYEATPTGAGQPASLTFPYGLPNIRPGQSAASYLLYKALKRGPTGDPREASAFELAGAPSRAATVADLVAVRGAGMPHDALPSDPGATTPRGALAWGELRLLRRWIDAGAHPCAR